MNTTTGIQGKTTNPPAIGAPVILRGGDVAHVVKVTPKQFKAVSLFGMATGDCEEIRFDVQAVTKDGARYHIDEWAGYDEAADLGLPAISAADAMALAIIADKRAQIEQAKREEAENTAAAARAVLQSQIDAIRPAWAVAAIIATHETDDCDSMSDYFNVKSGRRVLIGWSRHKRDLFPEMRKAALNFPDAAHLADASPDAENRCKYSMGGGYFLKVGGAYRTGWKVAKERYGMESLAGYVDEIAPALLAAPEPAAAPASTGGAPVSGGAWTISEHTHTKKGFQMWICQLADRVEREEFNAHLTAAKALGGWYSKAWQGTPGGFAFKDRAAALEFTGITPPDGDGNGGGDKPESVGAVAADTQPRPAAPAPNRGAAVAEKLRGLADGLDSKIADKFRDRPSNTPKRAREAGDARNDGIQLERGQKAMRALADAWEAGTVPAILANVTTKAAILDLAHEHIDHSQGGYYSPGRCMGTPRQWQDATKAEQAAALWAMLTPADPAKVKAAELSAKIDSLKFAKIEGYFPTPAAIVDSMMVAARISAGDSVLEPSAGSGAIADAVTAAGASVQCIERHSSLALILRDKGHKVEHCDFMQEEAAPIYDAALMNPPFERGQDCEHVRHAWGFVKPGGALVAIMGAGVMFRNQRPYSEFREWAESLGGEFVEIPAGAFKESGTGVATVMLTLCKEGEG